MAAPGRAERLVARSRERIDHRDHDDGRDDDAVPGKTHVPRGEAPTVPSPVEQPSAPAPAPVSGPEQADTGPVPARRSATEAAVQARREACTDPEIRFDFPDLLDDLEPTIGPGRELGSWLTPDAKDILQLRLDSTPIGWTAPLSDGPWGQAGWIALLHQPGGAGLLVDNLSRPKTHPTADLALDAGLRTHRTRGGPIGALRLTGCDNIAAALRTHRTRGGPIGALRLTGCDNIAAALRKHGRDATWPLDTLGIT
ncbi:hypothetical protein [Kitasatospora purpeofusca]|uniref:hypothetical protein n=1 Tax=Kitasatospora purpeofusca TaxID=67352 RepID=UPI0004C17D43|nr:hypothetical protein [Kitasatospora purpeofusca]